MVRTIFEDVDSSLELSNQDDNNGIGITIREINDDSIGNDLLFVLSNEDYDKFIEEITKIHNEGIKHKKDA